MPMAQRYHRAHRCCRNRAGLQSMGTRTITYSRVVHLSHVIAPDMPQWPGDPPLEIATVAERGVHGYYLRRVAIGEHSATHVNAPVSFCEGGAAIHATSADAPVAPAVVLDP